MAKKASVEVAEMSNSVEETKVHPLQKSYMLVSTKHVDYNDLTAFEAISLTAVFVLAVLVGVVGSVQV